MTQPSLLDIKINHTPAYFAQYLRDLGDIFWWDRAKFWVITKHEYAKSILTSPDFTCDRTPFFISRMPDIEPAVIKDFFGVVSKMMVMSDAPEHTSRRRICYNGFSNQTLDQLAPLINKTIDEQLSLCKRKGHIEIVADLAKIIPSTILADFFHIPASERTNFYEWSNNMTQFFGGSSQYRPEDGMKVNKSASSLRDYFVTLIKERRKQPKDDFLSILLANQSAFGLTDDEIVSQAIMMLVAGQVTTTDQLCNNIYTLMTTPHVLDQIQQPTTNLASALDELNRLDPAVTFIFRVTKNDTMIGNQLVKAGDVIFISTHAVNRDPITFSNPDECELTRSNNAELSFGFGSHYCIGAKLARMEMQTSFAELLKRFKGLRLMEDDMPVRKHHSLAFSGFERLSLTFD